jgi:hypothetical protein
MNETVRILTTIPADAPITIEEFCNRLGPCCPPWNLLFGPLEALECQELIKIQWDGRTMKTLQRTDLGSERAREAQQETR